MDDSDNKNSEPENDPNSSANIEKISKNTIDDIKEDVLCDLVWLTGTGTSNPMTSIIYDLPNSLKSKPRRKYCDMIHLCLLTISKKQIINDKEVYGVSLRDIVDWIRQNYKFLNGVSEGYVIRSIQYALSLYREEYKWVLHEDLEFNLMCVWGIQEQPIVNTPDKELKRSITNQIDQLDLKKMKQSKISVPGIPPESIIDDVATFGPGIVVSVTAHSSTFLMSEPKKKMASRITNIGRPAISYNTLILISIRSKGRKIKNKHQEIIGLTLNEIIMWIRNQYQFYKKYGYNKLRTAVRHILITTPCYYTWRIDDSVEFNLAPIWSVDNRYQLAVIAPKELYTFGLNENMSPIEILDNYNENTNIIASQPSLTAEECESCSLDERIHKLLKGLKIITKEENEAREIEPKFERPKMTYGGMIILSILISGEMHQRNFKKIRALQLVHIYTWIKLQYPYYRIYYDKMQKAVRSTLTISPCFYHWKSGTKGSLYARNVWSVDPSKPIPILRDENFIGFQLYEIEPTIKLNEPSFSIPPGKVKTERMDYYPLCKEKHSPFKRKPSALDIITIPIRSRSQKQSLRSLLTSSLRSRVTLYKHIPQTFDKAVLYENETESKIKCDIEKSDIFRSDKNINSHKPLSTDAPIKQSKSYLVERVTFSDSDSINSKVSQITASQ
ncbi:hypothetical protein A3Q56_05466 [Intoshia linei]|uniref:Fork-head domain-containing protein n=1 Tax=Intoshia linei TaxID=1819745 RepID=A0A177AZ88_9BILA|nr:hypothetical protein A3Q56_05466 [Intoshia linei]